MSLEPAAPVVSPEDSPTPQPVTPSLDAIVEAVLFTSETPVQVARLAEIAGVSRGEALEAIDRLNLFYADHSRSYRIVSLAGGFQLITNREFAPYLSRMHSERIAPKLSRAALETLAIIAFKQPVSRAEIDAIRGVTASDRVLRHLLERKAVRIAGRADAPGRPLLYGTTREFLSYFGLSNLSDLPRSDELAALLAGDRPPEEESMEEGLEEGPGASDVEMDRPSASADRDSIEEEEEQEEQAEA
ncbi:MAG TPA: SMC-Scp complex subunit ScpB [bacterium]|nr:SMC-Scp complex subunit ScpB [bacterium]